MHHTDHTRTVDYTRPFVLWSWFGNSPYSLAQFTLEGRSTREHGRGDILRLVPVSVIALGWELGTMGEVEGRGGDSLLDHYIGLLTL